MSRLSESASRNLNSLHRSRDQDDTLQNDMSSIDLSLLTRHLLPSDYVREESNVWNIDALTEKLSQEALESSEADIVIQGDI